MEKGVYKFLVLIVFPLLMSSCATTEGEPSAFGSFVKRMMPTIVIETENGYSALSEEYKGCMRSCVSHNETKQCIKYRDDAAEECNRFIGK